MLYLGIDVGKKWHEAALLSDTDEVLWRLRFGSNRAGLERLAERLSDVDAADLTVGLEATGVYWITLHRNLLDRGITQVLVLNPLQTRAFRNANLRGSKTDRIDAISIARLIRWAGRSLSTHVVPEERRSAAREVHRVRSEMVRLRAQQLIKLDAVLERIFPEFREVFSSLSTKSAQAVLARWPTPRLLLHASAEEITAVLQQARCRRVSPDLAQALLRQAAGSIGLADPLDASAAAIQALVAHVHHLEEQIEHLGTRLDVLLEPDTELAALLQSIPGIGPETTRTWLAESLPIEQFQGRDAAQKLVATIGIDAQPRESGQYTGKVKMSKRGNRHLRRAILLAARSASRSDPQFRAVLSRQLARGKHYNVAVSHVARKMVHIIYSVLKNQRPYELPNEYRLGILEPQLSTSGS
jgi:transposase